MPGNAGTSGENPFPFMIQPGALGVDRAPAGSWPLPDTLEVQRVEDREPCGRSPDLDTTGPSPPLARGLCEFPQILHDPPLEFVTRPGY